MLLLLGTAGRQGRQILQLAIGDILSSSGSYSKCCCWRAALSEKHVGGVADQWSIAIHYPKKRLCTKDSLGVIGRDKWKPTGTRKNMSLCKALFCSDLLSLSNFRLGRVSFLDQKKTINAENANHIAMQMVVHDIADAHIKANAAFNMQPCPQWHLNSLDSKEAPCVQPSSKPTYFLQQSKSPPVGAPTCVIMPQYCTLGLPSKSISPGSPIINNTLVALIDIVLTAIVHGFRTVVGKNDCAER